MENSKDTASCTTTIFTPFLNLNRNKYPFDFGDLVSQSHQNSMWSITTGSTARDQNFTIQIPWTLTTSADYGDSSFTSTTTYIGIPRVVIPLESVSKLGYPVKCLSCGSQLEYLVYKENDQLYLKADCGACEFFLHGISTSLLRLLIIGITQDDLEVLG